MGATNHTTNYNLPQFIGSDKPTWLGDVNGAMSTIDTQMKENSDLATTAKSTADTADTKAGTAITQFLQFLHFALYIFHSLSYPPSCGA